METTVDRPGEYYAFYAGREGRTVITREYINRRIREDARKRNRAKPLAAQLEERRREIEL